MRTFDWWGNPSSAVLSSVLAEVGGNPEVKRRFPRTSRSLIELGDALWSIVNELDKEVSDGGIINDDSKFDDESWERLHDSIIKDFSKDLSNL